MEVDSMHLTDLPQFPNCCVLRDGNFESVGLVTYQTLRMFSFLDDEHFLPTVLQNQAISCVVTKERFVEQLPHNLGILVTNQPKRVFFEIHNYLAEKTELYWKSFSSKISPDANIHPNAYVSPKDVKIGPGTLVEPHATILERTTIEDDVIVRAGAVIGCQGYEFKHLGNHIMPVAHAGGVWIHPRVEIQGNTVVDRAVFGGFTEIGEETKIDNLVHVAHNVRIGKRCRIVALAMLGGSVTIGDDAWIGPSAVISSEVSIGNGAFVTLGSVVTRNVADDQRVTGNWAIDHEKFTAFMRSIR